MSIWTMVWREVALRKLNFLIGLAGVAGAVGMLVSVLTFLDIHDARSDQIAQRKQQETTAGMTTLSADVKKAMQRLGYNAIILPQDQALGDWYSEDYAAKNMPEALAGRLAGTRELVDRYLPQLRKKIKWEEKKWTVLVVGFGAERILDTSVCDDTPIVKSLSPGSCALGYELGQALGLKVGDTISLGGTELQVARCEQEAGTKDDITIRMNLADAQRLLKLPSVINEILLVEHAQVWGHLAEVRGRVGQLLPECQVVEIASETLSRAHARIKMTEEAEASLRHEQTKRARLRAERVSTMLKLVPLGALVCVTWVGLLMYFNVRDRVEEIGVLMTIGFPAGTVRGLFLWRAVLLGVIGGLLGFALGTASAFLLERGGEVTAGLPLVTGVGYLFFSLAVGLLAGLTGAWLPARAAVATDPADVLGQQ